MTDAGERTPREATMHGVWTRAWWIAAVGLAVLLVGACSRPPASDAPRALRVLATTQQLADAVRRVAGERLGRAVTADALLGEGVDPHTYKPTRSDAARLNDADLVIFSGLHLEGKMADVLDELGRSGKRVVRAGEHLPEGELLRPTGSAGQPDPHFWMDTTLYTRAVEVVRDELIRADPDGRAVYEAGAAAFNAEVAGVDVYARRWLGELAPERRVLVTSHDAFGYFGRRYGLRVFGVQGLSTESEAGLRDIETLVGVIVRERVPTVFVETSVSRRTLDAVVAGAAAKGHTVIIGDALFSDAMGPPGTYEGTYIGMMDHNITIIARGLGAHPPEGGMSGKLKR